MKPTRLPAPEMPLLTPHDECSMAHLIERHISFYTEDRFDEQRTVALDPLFVRHYMKYRDSRLPVVSAIVTAPLVLANGTLLAQPGLDRKRSILFRLQPELVAIIPKPEDCTDVAAGGAMRFLVDEWLIDVKADYAGKCILIASLLSILERAVLPERPAFFVTAGKRGGGKTTTLQMLFVAATGHRVPAAAWSPNEEERRKVLFSYLAEGVPAVCWDNIPRGVAISCPSIEKSLTSASYSDRVLGKSETRTVPATTICFFTGNNISARGDLCSRSLQARLSVDRTDPENRKFTHTDPIEWTLAHRGNILAALYTILLANPRLKAADQPAETRFKAWWHLVGSAVEHAAKQHRAGGQKLAGCEPVEISFKDLFLSGEAEDEQASGVAWVLEKLRQMMPKQFTAADVAARVNEDDDDGAALLAAIESATTGKPLTGKVSGRVVTWRLKALLDTPEMLDDGKVYALRYRRGEHGGPYKVSELEHEVQDLGDLRNLPN